jgi:hypothetical protein
MRPTRSASKKRNVLEERQEAGMLWVAPVGDRRSYAILARNFLVENSINKKLNYVSACLSVVDTRRVHFAIELVLSGYLFVILFT